MTVSGLWVNDYQYRMYDARTHATRMIFVCAVDGGMSEPEEVADVVAEYEERFADELKETPDWQPMPIQQQHELGPHLRDIEASKARVREVGHGRYW